MFKRVMIPFDDSAPSKKALKMGIQFCKSQNAKLRIVYYIDYIDQSLGMEGIDIEELQKYLRKDANRLLKKAQKAALKSNLDAEVGLIESYKLTHRGMEEKILNEAKQWEADLLIISTHGREGIQHLLFGSNAENMIRKSHIPVLVIRSKHP